jgi:hypothetical protein
MGHRPGSHGFCAVIGQWRPDAVKCRSQSPHSCGENSCICSFDGKPTSSKWAQVTRSSQDTALRDIDALLALGILVKDAAGGRSISYSLAERA